MTRELAVAVAQRDRHDPVHLRLRGDVQVADPGHDVRRIADAEYRVKEKLHRARPRADDQVGVRDRVGEARPCADADLLHAKEEHDRKRHGEDRQADGEPPRDQAADGKTNEDHAAARREVTTSSIRRLRSKREARRSSWLTIRSVDPAAAHCGKSRSRNPACEAASSAEVGSSATISGGWPISARATATRCYCPTLRRSADRAPTIARERLNPSVSVNADSEASSARARRLGAKRSGSRMLSSGEA